MTAPATEISIIREGKSEKCGCPEREAMICGFWCIIHYEPDGSIDVFMDCGEWDADLRLEGCRDLDDATERTRQYIMALPVEA